MGKPARDDIPQPIVIYATPGFDIYTYEFDPAEVRVPLGVAFECASDGSTRSNGHPGDDGGFVEALDERVEDRRKRRALRGAHRIVVGRRN